MMAKNEYIIMHTSNGIEIDFKYYFRNAKHREHVFRFINVIIMINTYVSERERERDVCSKIEFRLT